MTLRTRHPRTKRNPSPVGPAQTPLGREPPGVLIQQPSRIDAVAGERPAPEVMDKQVMSHGQLKPGPSRPLGEIIIVKEPQP